MQPRGGLFHLRVHSPVVAETFLFMLAKKKKKKEKRKEAMFDLD